MSLDEFSEAGNIIAWWGLLIKEKLKTDVS